MQVNVRKGKTIVKLSVQELRTLEKAAELLGVISKHAGTAKANETAFTITEIVKELSPAN